jgi:hypothetical protein
MEETSITKRFLPLALRLQPRALTTPLPYHPLDAQRVCFELYFLGYPGCSNSVHTLALADFAHSDRAPCRLIGCIHIAMWL